MEEAQVMKLVNQLKNSDFENEKNLDILERIVEISRKQDSKLYSGKNFLL
jgi:hypothetical protein